MPDERSLDFKLSDFGAKLAVQVQKPEKLRLLNQIKEVAPKGKQATQVVRIEDMKLRKMLKQSLEVKGTSDGKMVVSKIKKPYPPSY
jgi:hypothetical protein